MSSNTEDEKVSNAVDYLLTLNEAQLAENQSVQKEIIFLENSLDLIDFDSLIQKNFNQILVNILLEIYNSYLDSIIQAQVFDLNNLSDQNSQKVFLLSSCLNLINHGCLKSVKFSRKLWTENGLEVHFMYVKNQDFLNKFSNVLLNDKNENKVNLIEKIVSNIYIFSKSSFENIQKWTNLDSVNTLLDLHKQIPSVKLDSYLTIMNIVNDKQIEELSQIHEIIGYIQHIIQQVSLEFIDKKFNRQFRQIVEDGNIVNVEVHCVKNENGDYLSLFVFLSGLYQLSVNDKLRRDIYFKNEFKSDLITIFLNGNEIEKKYTLRLFAQLSFDSKISQNLETQIDFIEMLKNLSTNNISILKLSNQIFWNIKQADLKSKHLNENKNGEHVMISYNKATRDLCMKIKAHLENNGIKVWIDVNNIHGSSLDSMAKAVENSFCVLICVTESYRQSVYCQSEAQYSYKLNKPIIPLIMQKGYENVKGWLGIIMSDKIFINFMKYDFDECIYRLEKEIRILGDVINETDVLNTLNLSNNSKIIEKWNTDLVKEWFNKNELNIKIYEKFNPFDGVILLQLFEMRRDAPEFYYQSIKSVENEHLDLNSVMKFTHCLNSLFKLKN